MEGAASSRRDKTTQGSSWWYLKVNSSQTLSIFGDKCPQNGSKNEEMAPRTKTGYPYIGPFVGLRGQRGYPESFNTKYASIRRHLRMAMGFEFDASHRGAGVRQNTHAVVGSKLTIGYKAEPNHKLRGRTLLVWVRSSSAEGATCRTDVRCRMRAVLAS